MVKHVTSHPPLVKVGKVIEFTEDQRREMLQLTTELEGSLVHYGEAWPQSRGCAQIILALFKIVQDSIRRSHAS